MISPILSCTPDLVFLVVFFFFSFLYFCISREEAVDFTHPFLYTGLGVLGYKGAASRSLQQLADDDSVKVILSDYGRF